MKSNNGDVHRLGERVPPQPHQLGVARIEGVRKAGGRKKAAYCAASVLVLLSTPALAYLDPGTGSLILQMLVAGVFGALIYIRFAWDRTRQFLLRLFGRQDTIDGHSAPDEAASTMDALSDDEPKAG